MRSRSLISVPLANAVRASLVPNRARPFSQDRGHHDQYCRFQDVARLRLVYDYRRFYRQDVSRAEQLDELQSEADR